MTWIQHSLHDFCGGGGGRGGGDVFFHLGHMISPCRFCANMSALCVCVCVCFVRIRVVPRLVQSKGVAGRDLACCVKFIRRGGIPHASTPKFFYTTCVISSYCVKFMSRLLLSCLSFDVVLKQLVYLPGGCVLGVFLIWLVGPGNYN